MKKARKYFRRFRCHCNLQRFGSGFGLSVASAIAGIRGPAVRVVLPIAASTALIGWAYDTYQYS